MDEYMQETNKPAFDGVIWAIKVMRRLRKKHNAEKETPKDAQGLLDPGAVDW